MRFDIQNPRPVRGQYPISSVPFFRIALDFYPNQKNPARPNGMGQYRVRRCYETRFWHPVKVFENVDPKTGTRNKRMYVSSLKPLKVGSRIDPVKTVVASALFVNQ